MDFYGIAAASMSMSTAKLAQSVQVSVMKKVMDTQEIQLQALEAMLPPPSGHTIDVYA